MIFSTTPLAVDVAVGAAVSDIIVVVAVLLRDVRLLACALRVVRFLCFGVLGEGWSYYYDTVEGIVVGANPAIPSCILALSEDYYSYYLYRYQQKHKHPTPTCIHHPFFPSF